MTKRAADNRTPLARRLLPSELPIVKPPKQSPSRGRRIGHYLLLGPPAWILAVAALVIGQSGSIQGWWSSLTSHSILATSPYGIAEAFTGLVANTATGDCLSVPANSVNDSVQLDHAACTGDAIQTWVARTRSVHGATVLEITNKRTGKCLDARFDDIANGTPVQQYACNGTEAQQWLTVHPVAGSTSFALKKVGSNKCLDVTVSQDAPGGLVDLSDCNGSALQSWSVHGCDGGSRLIVSYKVPCKIAD
jgi:Ricin-type beta-trefoil lectin domain